MKVFLSAYELFTRPSNAPNKSFTFFLYLKDIEQWMFVSEMVRFVVTWEELLRQQKNFPTLAYFMTNPYLSYMKGSAERDRTINPTADMIFN